MPSSADNSHLSDPRFGYDLVVATTQDAINATMDQFLSGYHGREISACYVWDPTQNKVISGDIAAAVAAAGVDPFTIPHGSNQDTPAVSALSDANFAFAFKARIGLPQGVRLDHLPAVIQLDKGSGSTVTYQLFFAEFTVLQLAQHGHALTWTNLAQEPGKPWVFAFDVNLDTRRGDASAFADLPPAVQRRVADLGAGAFSIQQLYLDLNTPGLQSSAEIAGLDPASDAAIALHQVFLTSYWDTFKTSDGTAAVPLGYTVQLTTPPVGKPSLQPTAITFETSAHRDENGQETRNYPVYTLDYLVMAGKDMPPEVSFPWNWVEPVPDNADGAATNPSGVMAVNRTAFAGYLGALLSPALNDVCWAPSVRLTTTSWVSFEAQLKKGTDPIHTPYTSVSDPADPAKVLTFAYTATSGDGCNPGVSSYRLDVTTSTTSDVWFRDTKIVISSTFTMHARSEGTGEDTKDGDFYKVRVDAAYTLGVADDRLVVTLDGGAPTVTDLAAATQSKNVLEGWFGSTSGGLVDQATRFFGNTSRYLADFDVKVADVLDSASGWVFPGGSTFAFKDPRFSAHQDLITQLTYRDIAPTGEGAR